MPSISLNTLHLLRAALVLYALLGFSVRLGSAQDQARLAALLARHCAVENSGDIALLASDASITAARALEAAAKDLSDAKLALGAVDQLGTWVAEASLSATASDALATAGKDAKDAGVRRRAVELLAEKRGDRKALRAIYDRSEEPTLRAIALKGMVEAGPFDEELKRLCMRALFDVTEKSEVRVAAIDSKPYLEKLDLSDLSKLVEDGDANIRLRALKRMRVVNERAAEAIAKARLSDAAASVQIEAGTILLDSGVPVNALLVLDQLVTTTTQVRDRLHPKLLERASSPFLKGLEDRLENTNIAEHEAKVLTRVLGDLVRKSDASAIRIARKLLSHQQTYVRARLAQALADAKDRGSIGAITKLLRSSLPHVRVEGLRALTAIQGNDPGLAKTLLEALSDSAIEVRIAAVDCLASMSHPSLGANLLPLLAENNFSLRLAVIEALVRLRYAPAIPLFIAGLEAAQGRFAEDYAHALRLMTNEPFRRHAPDWRRWWADHGATFVPPPLDEAQSKELAFRARQRELGSTSSFYGLEILSDRVVFVIDQSGSMAAKAGTRSTEATGKTRLEIAKEELLRYVTDVPDHHLFNIVLFGTGVKSFADEMLSPRGSGREDARKWVEQIPLQGATNLYGGLKRAFAMQDVDTIYLLTDGDPSAGEEVDPALILEDVQYWNRERRIIIHSISIGTRSELLRKLAEDTGGDFIVR